MMPMVLSENERRVLNETRLRNLKRRYAKVIQIPELTEEAIELKADIDALEKQL